MATRGGGHGVATRPPEEEPSTEARAQAVKRLLERARKLKNPTWAEEKEFPPFREPKFNLHAMRLTPKPPTFPPPRPFLEAGHGHWRKSWVLLGKEVQCTEWEDWTTLPDEERYRKVPSGATAMVTIFGMPKD